MALLSKLGQVLSADLAKEFKLKKTTLTLEKSFIEQIKQCQPTDHLGKKIHLSQNYLSALIIEAIKNCPSVQNIHSLRFMLLYHNTHQNFWDLVEKQQRQHIPAHIFAATTQKMQACKNAFGTILFFEDQHSMQYLNKNQPLSAEHHVDWSAQYLGVAILAAWGALCDVGLGADLMHYHGFDHLLQRELNVKDSWQLKSQLIFGSIEQKNPVKQDSFLAEYYQVLS